MPDAVPPPPCNPWKLNIVGGLDCEAYTLDDTKLWPDDLCGEDWVKAELCPAISDDGKKVKDKILECKYYQHGFAGMIAGCTFLAMGGGIICGVYALKAATKPS